jgi:hypothetical protein
VLSNFPDALVIHAYIHGVSRYLPIGTRRSEATWVYIEAKLSPPDVLLGEQLQRSALTKALMDVRWDPAEHFQFLCAEGMRGASKVVFSVYTSGKEGIVPVGDKALGLKRLLDPSQCQSPTRRRLASNDKETSIQNDKCRSSSSENPVEIGKTLGNLIHLGKITSLNAFALLNPADGEARGSLHATMEVMSFMRAVTVRREMVFEYQYWTVCIET